MDEEKIRALFENLGQVVSTGDLKPISSGWTFPALVFFTDDEIAVDDSSQMERRFAQAAGEYRRYRHVSGSR